MHAELTNRKALVQELRAELSCHVESLDLPAAAEAIATNGSKAHIRESHRAHRAQAMQRERIALEPHLSRLIAKFADGSEVEPSKIDPTIVTVESDHETGRLFRLATTLWSVPVSKGYGRRMRFLIMDSANDKLIGVLALGDPVFNLRTRDEWIGWNASQRKSRLSSVMDAYVVGAVPPYSAVLGGKLVASLMGSREIVTQFEKKYSGTRGIISGSRKNPRLVLVTVTSALGRSSIYNRVKLPGLLELVRIGTTTGWGHFHVSDSTFSKMRALLALDEHRYASGHAFGQGPNWRIRVIREAVKRIGLDEDLLRHGIKREIFAMPLGADFREYLLGSTDRWESERPTCREIGRAAIDRWVGPRAARQSEFRSWTRGDTLDLIRKGMWSGNEAANTNGLMNTFSSGQSSPDAANAYAR